MKQVIKAIILATAAFTSITANAATDYTKQWTLNESGVAVIVSKAKDAVGFFNSTGGLSFAIVKGNKTSSCEGDLTIPVNGKYVRMEQRRTQGTCYLSAKSDKGHLYMVEQFIDKTSVSIGKYKFSAMGFINKANQVLDNQENAL